MGIVRKQSIYSTVFIYIGFAIGAINTLVLFPKFLGQDYLGLSRSMLDFAVLFSAIATLGAMPAMYKFFPFYRFYLPKDKNDLPFLSLVCTCIGSLLFTICIFIFKDFFIRKFSKNSALFVEYYYWLIPLTVSYTFFLLFEGCAWLVQKTVASNLIKELFSRILVTLLFVCYFFHLLSKEAFITAYALIYIPSALLLLWLVMKKGEIRFIPRISQVTKRLYKRIISFSAFHFSGSVVRILPLALGGLMIASISTNGLSDTAIYTIAIYLVSIMEVPQRSMTSITVSIIAEAWKNKDLNKIEEMYHKTSLNLLIAGVGIFGILLLNIDNLVRFEGVGYAPIVTIFVIMGISKLIDLGMGMNDQIMTLSKYWKMDFFISISFILINIPLTYYFIKRFGLNGSAYGQFISVVFFNMMRFIAIWKLFKMQPFTVKSLYVILLAALVILPIRYFIPYAGNLYLDTIIRTIIYLGIFGAMVIGFRLSPDIYEVYRTFLKRFGLKGNKS